MQNCSLASLPFHPFTYSGPIVFVLIKQLLARMNRDVYTLIPACTPTCYFTCYVHAYARMLDHSPRDCTANLHLTAIKNNLRTRQGNGEAKGHPEKWGAAKEATRKNRGAIFGTRGAILFLVLRFFYTTLYMRRVRDVRMVNLFNHWLRSNNNALMVYISHSFRRNSRI